MTRYTFGIGNQAHSCSGFESIVVGVTHVDMQTRGSLVASVGSDRTLRLWDADTGNEAAAPLVLSDMATGVSFFSDDQALALFTRSAVHFWKVPIDKQPDHPTPLDLQTFHKSIPFAVWKAKISPASACLSPDGKHVAAGTHDGRVLFWSLAEDKLVSDYQLEGLAEEYLRVGLLEFSMDGKRLAVTNGGYHVSILNTESLKKPHLVARFTHRGVHALRLSPDGTLLVTSGYKCDTRVWSVTTGLWLGRIEGQQQRDDDAQSLAISSSGTWLASGVNAEVRLWRLKATGSDGHQSEEFY